MAPEEGQGPALSPLYPYTAAEAVEERGLMDIERNVGPFGAAFTLMSDSTTRCVS